MSDNRPILNPQVSHTSELAHVARHHGQIVNKRNRCNLHIERANHISRPLQFIADAAIDIGGAVIEWQGNKLPEQSRDLRFALLGSFILSRAVHQFRADDCAQTNLLRGRRGEPVSNGKIETVPCARPHELNPDVAIEGVTLHQTFAGGSGNSGAISNSTSARQPMNSAKSGRRSFSSSTVGSSASAIIRLTRSSTSFALSASSRLSSSVSCFGILLMPASCHAPRSASTSLLL